MYLLVFDTIVSGVFQISFSDCSLVCRNTLDFFILI